MEVEYRKCRTYEISGQTVWTSYLYSNKEKALSKLSELTGKCMKDTTFMIRVNPDGQIPVDFDEDKQMSKTVMGMLK